MKKWEEKAIKEIMGEFDFKKMNKVMTLLDWRWHGGSVPATDKLKQRARELLNDVIKDKAYSIESGGFMVLHNKERKAMKLMFVVEDWEYEG
jgi:hypothetical protein